MSRKHDKESHREHIKKPKKYKAVILDENTCEGCANYPAGQYGCSHFIQARVSEKLADCNKVVNIIYQEEKWIKK